MELIDLAMKGTPFLLLGLLVVVVRLVDRVNAMSEDLKSIKSKITWGDLCDERHETIERRLTALERVTGLNGSVAHE